MHGRTLGRVDRLQGGEFLRGTVGTVGLQLVGGSLPKGVGNWRLYILAYFSPPPGGGYRRG